jgi:ABC-type nickel/cobalt efflux system permease component RcnA
VVVLGGIAAFFASARSLQIGPAVPVIAVTAIAGNASSIPAGIIVFGDPVGSNTMEIVMRMFAFVLVIAAAALIPAPVRAALGDGAAEQQRADHGHDGRDEGYGEAHDAHEREDEAHDRDHAGRAAGEHELVRATLAAPSRGRSA